MTIGVLGLQGGFEEHTKMLKRIGVNSFEIRDSSHLNREMDGLIIPGGESTVMGRLLHSRNLFGFLKDMISEGLPVFGTCAGLILLAHDIEGQESPHLGTLPISVQRNGYGRQLGSFHSYQTFAGLGRIPMRFIRAPYITSCGCNVRPLANHEGRIVAAESDTCLVTAFHPELTEDPRVHAYFIHKIDPAFSLTSEELPDSARWNLSSA
ncbi:MAG: pyridoxal 5'-phosphate synthase glutaminase subunit PdxT [Sphaerochaetaceae bacterium]|nr:pyridoxal 5'-phosphate synthase glutaminase subunit PdxT [Sphaerochaetaceae bacterium]